MKPPVARKLAVRHTLANRHTNLVCLTASFLATCVSDSYFFWLLMVSSFNYFRMHVSMVYKHAYLNILLLLHSAFILCVVKPPLKGAVGSRALNSHRNYIVDHGNSWKNHGILFLNFYVNPGSDSN